MLSDYFAALLRTKQAFVAPTQGKLLNYVHRVPLGVVAQITVSYACDLCNSPLMIPKLKPFNHPLLIAVKKMAPALAAGNSVIVKPSEVSAYLMLNRRMLKLDS
jgi:acyl-CoA reductase-like NAD-dependent aldehyde dehydrogenase